MKKEGRASDRSDNYRGEIIWGSKLLQMGKMRGELFRGKREGQNVRLTERNTDAGRTERKELGEVRFARFCNGEGVTMRVWNEKLTRSTTQRSLRGESFRGELS